MVQIAEYTRRENAQPFSSGGTNLQLPGAFTRQRDRETPLEKGLKLSKDLLDVATAMKERRDDGIVSAFMNQYDKASTQKLLELKDRFRGQESNKVMSAFQEWRDGYIAKYSSYDPDNAEQGSVYLENEAQTRIATQKLDAYNVRDINSISSYIAQEEEGFRVNNLQTSVENNTQRLIDENFPQNAKITKAAITSDIASLYRGQSKAFIDSAAGDVIDSAIYGNIMRDSVSNPISSINRFQDKDFTKEMKTETKEKAREQLIKYFTNYQAQQMAAAATGRESSPAGDEFYKANADFFKGRLNQVKNSIEEEAIKIRNEILEKDESQRVALLNDYTVQLIDAQSSKDPQKMAQVLSAMTGVRGGVETASLLNSVDKEYNEYEYLKRADEKYQKYGDNAMLIENGAPVPPRAQIQERLDFYTQRRLDMVGKLDPIVHNINLDKYDTLSDIPEFDNFPPEQKQEIVTAFANRARYNSLSQTAKKNSGVDFENRIYTIYKNERGEPDRTPVEYNTFKYEMSQKIVKFMAQNPNKIPDAKELQKMANDSMNPVAEKTAEDQINKMIANLKYTDKRHRDYATNYEAVKKGIKKNVKGWYHNDTEEMAIEQATAFILDNDKLSAYHILKEANLLD